MKKLATVLIVLLLAATPPFRFSSTSFAAQDSAPTYAQRVAVMETQIQGISARLTFNPDDARLLQARGELLFRTGKFEESVKDFDRVVELAPDSAPYNWQRGLALYYVGRYEDGRAQFETHRTVNPQDVENSAWHFLCTAKATSVDEARKELIPVDGDARIPMKQVLQLFAGTATPEDVLKAAGNTNADQQLYAHLYIGLFYEASGDTAKAKEHMNLAAKIAPPHYMGDVARVHAIWLNR